MKYYLLISASLLFFNSISSQVITIGPSGDFLTLESAESSITAGDTVVLLDGTFSDGTQFLTINGTKEQPIVIKAENRHQAIMQGGTESIHLVSCSYVEIEGLLIQGQSGNGMNIDDGGTYTIPTHHITIRDCIFQDMAANGNNDLLKLSGLDSFLIENCVFQRGGEGGSGVDMVGCHHGTIQDNYFNESGVTGIQAKGGTQFILIRRNIFENMSQRALNLGGSTGLQFFRPPLPDPIVDAFEAADLEVYSNIFIRNWAPIAYVGSVRVKVYNNTFYDPQNWVIRILQETTVDGFLACADNEFRNNIVYLPEDLREVNIGPNTNPESFLFSNNLWYNASDAGNWLPDLPVTDFGQIISNPKLIDPENGNFDIEEDSPAIGAGLFLVEPQTDYHAKPYANPPSIGAFEGAVSTSVENEFNEPEIIIFPNPTKDQIQVISEADIHSLTLFDISGRLLSYTESRIMNLGRLQPGMYCLQIHLSNQLISKSVIVN